MPTWELISKSLYAVACGIVIMEIVEHAQTGYSVAALLLAIGAALFAILEKGR